MSPSQLTAILYLSLTASYANHIRNSDGSGCSSGCGENTRSVTSCTNFYDKCDIWHLEGECTRNPAFMELYCRNSCNMCGVPLSQTDSAYVDPAIHPDLYARPAILTPGWVDLRTGTLDRTAGSNQGIYINQQPLANQPFSSQPDFNQPQNNQPIFSDPVPPQSVFPVIRQIDEQPVFNAPIEANQFPVANQPVFDGAVNSDLSQGFQTANDPAIQQPFYHWRFKR